MNRALSFAKRHIAVFMVACFVAVASLPVQAALPTEATAAFTSLGTDATDMIAAGWPIVVIVVGGLLVIKLFKKVMSKST